ncbi:SDR family NAD(P)-dependent oxidoreductase [Actinomadura opuntiae]|uniref:SDR family NAD(P)-dependent oxidoreductase n=1 Tax=Actinomadura sp. OS1-43 TaxID=604315 RepID=UPI00255B17BC|nr:SDR family NAD(P)-dependent oxidoreductase [Actinomadura sp. OS1-43]MDL4814700.1 SDR family NAD(P)-dependent oxidoreductase [Actinomadura sp. OS1-43]
MRRTALVTGAARGIGALAARRLAAAAWDVVAVDRDEEGLAATAFRSPNTHVRTCDITDPKDVADILAMTGAVHRLVVASAPGAPDTPADAAVRNGFLGTVDIVRAVLPGMLERGAGEVIVIAPPASSPASSATAAAACAYVEALADEQRGRGVAFRCASPSAGVPARLVLDEIDRSLARSGQVRVAPGRRPGPLRRALARAAAPR